MWRRHNNVRRTLTGKSSRFFVWQTHSDPPFFSSFWTSTLDYLFLPFRNPSPLVIRFRNEFFFFYKPTFDFSTLVKKPMQLKKKKLYCRWIVSKESLEIYFRNFDLNENEWNNNSLRNQYFPADKSGSELILDSRTEEGPRWISSGARTAMAMGIIENKYKRREQELCLQYLCLLQSIREAVATRDTEKYIPRLQYIYTHVI